MAIVYLCLGSNLGDKNAYLDKAIAQIGERVGKVLKCSERIETEPWGVSEAQDAYLNQSLEVETDLEPLALLEMTQSIEQHLGRVGKGERKPRTVDIDILYYENQIINLSTLIVPHPFAHERDFVLDTMLQIAPNFLHPILQKTQKRLKEEREDSRDKEK